jgi:hypothetical protein
MRVLVCGSRDFSNARLLDAVVRGYLTSIATTRESHVIIHGAARGADTLAGECADRIGVRVESYPADWDRYGKRAGYVRNQQMLDEGKPDLVVAFYSGEHKSKGTEMMVKIASQAGVECWEIFGG